MNSKLSDHLTFGNIYTWTRSQTSQPFQKFSKVSSADVQHGKLSSDRIFENGFIWARRQTNEPFRKFLKVIGIVGILLCELGSDLTNENCFP